MSKAMTQKQKAFVAFFCLTFNGTESARLSKYRGNDNVLSSIAYENLRKREIRDAIEERLEANIMGKNELLNHIGNIARDYDRNDQLRALELLGKYLNVLEDKHRLTISTINLNRLDDSQILRIANGEDYLSVITGENKS